MKILAVDDEPLITASLSFIFERPRYELTSARDANDALTQLSATPVPYDVIITDNNMPHASGVELVRELRERSFRGKIMVLSAHLNDEIREAYEQMNVDVILDKPFDIHKLRKTLDLPGGLTVAVKRRLAAGPGSKAHGCASQYEESRSLPAGYDFGRRSAKSSVFI